MKALWWYLPLEALVILLAQQAMGFAPAHALLAITAAAAVTVMLVALPDIQEPRWPRESSDRRDGARDQVTALSWAFMTRDESVSTRGLHAVRKAATARLALHGVDLADPAHARAARELLGQGAYALLTTYGPPPSMAQLGRCIDRLTAIEPAALMAAAPHVSPATPRQPSPRIP
ncbi:hypothetical protein SAMN05216410_1312 [Sanguibacter gelidistatuariae]|uniref:Uncharacterized protein n=1 Tax=Sanguibacter gelidistatuariae TaxID=1814289 RepID=A0A1G6JDI3_9MICO|nr:hypothetical protein [Sanguibacter gelidistatuariae]SDC16707.1 hypothetical protein SAMN05216410_1312 [Sanguibacter gelidistatuariae]